MNRNIVSLAHHSVIFPPEKVSAQVSKRKVGLVAARSGGGVGFQAPNKAIRPRHYIAFNEAILRCRYIGLAKHARFNIFH